MTNRQIVSKLRELGHEVEVYVRKDGSIRVISLDGVKYSSRLSEGVRAARELYYAEGDVTTSIEQTIYEGVKRQRAAARASRQSGDTLRSQSAEFQAEYKRFQAQVRKINKRLVKQGKKPSFFVSWETTRRGARKGNISIEQQLKRAKDYFAATSQGIAPSQMVQELLERLEEYSGKFPELINFINLISSNFDKLDIYQVKRTIEWLYGYVKEIRQSETWQERLEALSQTIHK